MTSATPVERVPEGHSLAVRIKAVCAWCSCILREGAEPPSHGICDRCLCELCGISVEELAKRRREWAEEDAQ
jgi:hypothetical protein